MKKNGSVTTHEILLINTILWTA